MGKACCCAQLNTLSVCEVENPINKDWGIGQVQSIINDKVTVNFENVGKKVINAKNIELIKLND